MRKHILYFIDKLRISHREQLILHITEITQISTQEVPEKDCPGDYNQDGLVDLKELIEVIRKRKTSSLEKSYTSKLLKDKKLSVEKVKEEIGELIEAVEKDTNKIHESADVLYHLAVFLEANSIKIEDVMKELEKRKNK